MVKIEKIYDPESGAQIGYGENDLIRLTQFEGRTVNVELRDEVGLWMVGRCACAPDKTTCDVGDDVITVTDELTFDQRYEIPPPDHDDLKDTCEKALHSALPHNNIKMIAVSTPRPHPNPIFEIWNVTEKEGR